MAQPGEHRALLAEVAAQREVAELGTPVVDRPHPLEGVVGAAVVDEDDLARPPEIVEDR